MKKIICLFGICALLAVSCDKPNPEADGTSSGSETPGVIATGKNPIVSITKSYSFTCNSAMTSLADISIVYAGADGKPSAPEKLSGRHWEKKGIVVPVGSKATAVEGSDAGISVICRPNVVPDNNEYDVTYEMECSYVVTLADGTTCNLPVWNINPQMPAVEGRNAEEACNAVSLSCTDDKRIVCDDQGNAYLADSDYWENEQGEYEPREDLGGATQESPTTSVGVDYADSPDAVDLGFTVDGKPLLWAIRNVGAQAPGDFGGLYGWGDASGYHTETNPVFYPARHPENIVGKNNNSISGTRCDIAQAMWGRRWRMPSKAEWEALAANCTWKKRQMNGNWGFEFTSKVNGNSIFLPGADARYGENYYRDSMQPENCHGYYWSGDWVATDAQMAYHFYFSLFSTGTVYTKAQGNKDRYYGMSVRPVTSIAQQESGR